jgi:hypothetical protein
MPDPAPTKPTTARLINAIKANTPYVAYRGKRKLLTFQGTINGHSAHILLDTGAMLDLVDTAFASRTRLRRTIRQGQPVGMADGTVHHIQSAVEGAQLVINDYNDTITLHELPLAHYDIILGEPWMTDKSCIINWPQRRVDITHHFS